MYEIIGIWVAAFFTIGIFSFLYKENPLYRLAEHLVVGVSMGYFIVVTWNNVLMPRLVENMIQENQYILIIPALIGLLYITRFFPSVSWLSRYPIAFVLGTASGVALPRTMLGRVLRQLEATMVPIFSEGAGWAETLGIAVMIFGTLAALIYFFFSKPHKGLFFGTGSKIGIWVIMVGFGATFGFTVMGRISLLIGRVQFLLFDWLGTMGIHIEG
jgi:hypothetical protein